MKRIHFFEWEDFTWFPSFLRDYGTDFLQFLANRTTMYNPVVPVLGQLLARSPQHTLIDLGSGGGGGMIRLNRELRKQFPDLKIILTDYFPNQAAFAYTLRQADNFSCYPEPVDARQVPADLAGVRTLFLTLHHFRPKDAVKILQDAVDAGAAIGVFEAQERNFPSVLAMLLSPVSVWLTTPFIRPFKIGRLIFTYLIPVVPLFVLWDGVVSSFRTYNVEEMKELVNQIHNKDTYEWEINRVRSGPGVILYLTGISKQAAC